MKTKHLLLSGALLLATASLSSAQDAGKPADKPADKSAGASTDRPAGGQDGKRRPPPNPLLALFDTNHDGVISADEIAAAPAVLKALDKNGDGQLTGDELRPPRPPRGPGGPGGDQGPRDGQGKGPGGPGGDDNMPPPPPPPPEDAQ